MDLLDFSDCKLYFEEPLPSEAEQLINSAARQYGDPEAEMSLLKADMNIARLYAGLATDPELAGGFFAAIQAEYELSEKIPSDIYGSDGMLVWARRSSANRESPNRPPRGGQPESTDR